MRSIAALIAIGSLLACSSTPPVIIAPTPAPVAVDPEPPVSAPTSKPRSVKEPPPIAWIESDADARALAHKLRVPLVVYVRASWAAPCIAMERDVWTDPEVRRAARSFVMLRLDATDTDSGVEMTISRYDVAGIPSIVIVDVDGRTTAVTGYVDKAKLVRVLNAARP